MTANKNCEYEWGVHVSVFSEAAGLTREQVAATRLAGADEPCWDDKATTLIQCVDDLCNDACIGETVYTEFQRLWTVEEQLEIMSLCGNYHLISFVANSSRLPPESTAARFP